MTRENLLPEPLPRAYTFRWRWIPAILLAAAGLLLWKGSIREPADWTADLTLQGAEVAAELEGESFRIASFNIHGGKGLDGIRDLSRTADCLRGFHLAGLNESYGRLVGINENQAGEIADQLGMAWVFAPTLRRWWHDHFGNSLLSSVELTSWQRIPLPSRHGRNPRNVLLASFVHRGRRVHVLVTHLDTREDRPRQLQTVIDLFRSLESPAILMGDLNTNRADPQLEALLDGPEVNDAVGAYADADSESRIDWILTRGLETVDAGIVPAQVSDHPLVWAELRIAPVEQDQPSTPSRALPLAQEPRLHR